MSSYGVGQGIAQGVQGVTPLLVNAMRMKQQDKQFYDALAVRQGWQDGRMDDQPMATSPADIDQTSQVGRLEVPGRQLDAGQPQPGALALVPQAARAPRMPQPGAGMQLRQGRRLF